MKIDVVSDINCPWCAIGLNSLEIALQRLAGEFPVELKFHPFELNPDMPREGEDVVEHIGRKYGAPPEQVRKMHETIRERGAAVGFEFDVQGRKRLYNSFDAHRLLHWAGLEGRQRELEHALFKACFTDAADIADAQVLAQAAHEAGLDREKALAIVQSREFADEVRQEEQQYLQLGIHSVPSFIVDDRHLIQGGQPPEVFEQALRQLAAEAG